ncbi:MAG: flagellar basal body P-ring formation chaperone FlgA [Pseudomonadota bacterium]|nr:flagellar basal body P-ring formation chaperone FlgA [Pseudomonadota bacterium]MDP1904458.1 flagellar basal body P-ring formation chaperone FlgA [Pseudomonadota bacterium]MDP2351390.1 flagellar basal body P-ring formation chaperone FlgA [Pseudomonadota bacterium]
MTLPILPLLLFLLPLPAAAAGNDQDTQLLRQSAGAWLEQRAAAEWPDVRARAETGGVDERLRLPSCRGLQFSLPLGARLGGAGSVKAQCLAPVKWSLYLSFQMRLSGPAVVARRELPARALLGDDDLEIRVIDFDRVQSDYLSDPQLAIGAHINQRLAAGQPLLAESLSRPPAVNAGQRVRVVARGAGFSVNQVGSALNTAAAGQPVRVKLLSGRVLQGIAQDDGSVLIRP